MRTGRMLSVIVAVLAMAGAAGAQTPQTPMSCADLAQYGDVTVVTFEGFATGPGGSGAYELSGTEFPGITLTPLPYVTGGQEVQTKLWAGRPTAGLDNCVTFYGNDFVPVSGDAVFSPGNCYQNPSVSPTGAVRIDFDAPVLAVGLTFLDAENGFSNIKAFDGASGGGISLGQAIAQNVGDNSQAFRHIYDSNGSILSAVIELGILPQDGVGIDDLCYVTPAVPPCESELIAGQDYDNPVGNVVVTDDCDGVKVKLTANEGFAFSEIHVGAGCVGDESIPVNRKGQPQIGQFYFSEEYPDVWLTEQEVTIPLDVALPCEGEPDIDVAVHAVVKYLTPECQQPTVMLHATANSVVPADATTFPADIYRIFPTVPAEVYLTSQTESVNEYTENFNGNAFDGTYFYFSRFDWSGSPNYTPYNSELFFNDLAGNFGPAGPIDGASGGTVHGGYYYYFKERTDDLYRLPLNGNGTVGVAAIVNDNVLDDVTYPGAVLAFGDIAIRAEDGKIFGSATRLPGGNVFFSANLDGTGYTELPFIGGSIGAGGIQIAFGADGVLYGVNARSPLQLISIDLTEENLGKVTVISTLARSYSDLASGGYCDVPDETAWASGCDPDAGIQFSDDSGWAMYFKYDVKTGTCPE